MCIIKHFNTVLTLCYVCTEGVAFCIQSIVHIEVTYARRSRLGNRQLCTPESLKVSGKEINFIASWPFG